MTNFFTEYKQTTNAAELKNVMRSPRANVLRTHGYMTILYRQQQRLDRWRARLTGKDGGGLRSCKRGRGGEAARADRAAGDADYDLVGPGHREPPAGTTLRADAADRDSTTRSRVMQQIRLHEGTRTLPVKGVRQVKDLNPERGCQQEDEPPQPRNEGARS